MPPGENSRKGRIQSYPTHDVSRAIEGAIFGSRNRKLCSDIFVEDMTYDEAAEANHYSPRGCYNKMEKLGTSVENYLIHNSHRLN